MTWLRVLFSRLRGLFSGKQAERELNDEIRAHLEMLEEENRRRGMSPGEAHNAAMREFGGVEQMKETYREINGLRFAETLIQDVRYSLRMLRRNPGFAGTVVLLLALGIGANTAIFSAIDAVMLRLLPVKDPQQLVILSWSSQNYPRDLVNSLEGGGIDRGPGGPKGSNVFSYSTFTVLAGHNRVFSETFAFAGNNERINVGLSDRAESAIQQGVSGNYFAGVGVQAVLGRTILPPDDQESASPVAVLSYSFWRQKLGADPSIVDKTIVVNGNSITIVGVAPRDFFGLEPGASPDFWVPLHLYSRQMQQLGNLNNGLPYVQDSLTWWLQIVGRLQPGATEAQAQTEMDVLFQRSIRASGVAIAPDRTPKIRVASIKRGLDTLRFQYSKSLLLLLAMAGMVLLVACSNLAALLLARATARQKEIAVRLSLGARRSRLLRQLLTESMLFAALGGVAALLFAFWADSALSALLSSGRSVLGVELRLNGPVLAFTAVVSIFSGIVFGLAPALRATRTSVAILKPGVSSLPGTRFAAGKFLASGQIAMSLLLLISAGLLLRTLRGLENVDLGFDRQQLLLFKIAPGLNNYKDVRLSDYYRELQRRIETIPGVRSATFSTRAPVGEGTGSSGGYIPGYVDLKNGVDFYRHSVGPGYFETLRIPVVLGRAIGPRDDQSAPLVAVVNQKLVADCFHGDNPIGHKIVFGGSGKQQREYEVVGVVQDAKYGGLRMEIPPTVYFSYLQFGNISNFMTFEVRGSGSVESLAAAIRRETLSLDRNVPLIALKTQDDVISEMLVLERTFAALSSAFGGLALLLACVGLYGTMAYTVARRTSEIGIRMALGARREKILGMILRETFTVVTFGLIAGLPLAWAATTALQNRLFGLSAHNPATMVLAVAAIVAVSAIAGYIPARRASRVDPMVALRYE